MFSYVFLFVSNVEMKDRLRTLCMLRVYMEVRIKLVLILVMSGNRQCDLWVSKGFYERRYFCLVENRLKIKY